MTPAHASLENWIRTECDWFVLNRLETFQIERMRFSFIEKCILYIWILFWYGYLLRCSEKMCFPLPVETVGSWPEVALFKSLFYILSSYHTKSSAIQIHVSLSLIMKIMKSHQSFYVLTKIKVEVLNPQIILITWSFLKWFFSNLECSSPCPSVKSMMRYKVDIMVTSNSS